MRDVIVKLLRLVFRCPVNARLAVDRSAGKQHKLGLPVLRLQGDAARPTESSKPVR